ncbi:hypothetical protein L3Y34_009355 [Caenorhabditis briggsae]|uniref:GH18 domain-containing protein n=1 Tax=Caenorhabditis briggsae TaxID=6238 RepID=A0AAE9D434_CAEBR|nr:hypothetical protein L3Y34_009355 [Caenorhabditis briggsae]
MSNSDQKESLVVYRLKKTSKTQFYAQLLGIFCFGFVLSTILVTSIFVAFHFLWGAKPAILLENSKNAFILSGNYTPCNRRIIGWTRLYDKEELTNEQVSRMTHVILGPITWQFGIIRFRNKMEKEVFERLQEKAKSHDVKLLLSMEIDNEVNDPATNLATIKMIWHLNSFLTTHKIDGIELNWKFPIKNQAQIVYFCEKMRQYNKNMAREFVLALSLPASDIGLNIESIMEHVDFLNIETADYYSPLHLEHPQLIGPPSPLYSGHAGVENVDSTMTYYGCVTKHPEKLNMKLMFGGRYWKNVRKPIESSEPLWMLAERYHGNVDGDWLAWKDLENSGWALKSASWNNESKTPCIYDQLEQTYLAFENERSLLEKIRYAIDKNIGGFVIWKPIFDDEENKLLDVMASSKFCSTGNNKTVNFDCDVYKQ